MPEGEKSTDLDPGSSDSSKTRDQQEKKVIFCPQKPCGVSLQGELSAAARTSVSEKCSVKVTSYLAQPGRTEATMYISTR